MSEHKLPRTSEQPRLDERFVITENATGRRLTVRDMTDAELEHHIAQSSHDHMATMTQAMAMVGQATNIAKMNAALTYEQERRQKTIAIVGDLSQVRGLRKQ